MKYIIFLLFSTCAYGQTVESFSFNKYYENYLGSIHYRSDSTVFTLSKDSITFSNSFWKLEDEIQKIEGDTVFTLSGDYFKIFRSPKKIIQVIWVPHFRTRITFFNTYYDQP